jgi:hypothetical protein
VESDGDGGLGTFAVVAITLAATVGMLILAAATLAYSKKAQRDTTGNAGISMFEALIGGGEVAKRPERTPHTNQSGARNLQPALSDIRLMKEVGRGAAGVVWKGLWRGTDVAVKRLNLDLELENGQFQIGQGLPTAYCVLE